MREEKFSNQLVTGAELKRVCERVSSMLSSQFDVVTDKWSWTDSSEAARCMLINLQNLSDYNLQLGCRMDKACVACLLSRGWSRMWPWTWMNV